MSPAIQNFASSNLEQALLDHVSIAEPWALVERFAGLARISGSEDERAGADLHPHPLVVPHLSRSGDLLRRAGGQLLRRRAARILDPRLRK